VPAGSVISINPGSGTVVQQGTSITIHVSTGKEQVDIPDTKGKTLDEAKSILEGAGFKVVVDPSSKNPQGTDTVQSSDPEAGSKKVDKGSTVTLTLQPASSDSSFKDSSSGSSDNSSNNSQQNNNKHG
jgi:serine/threonine-protein kinase